MAADDPRTRLIVLFGGQSAEHDVSCISAAHVLRAVDHDRYEVVPVAITREGSWVLSEATARALADDTARARGALAEVLPESLPTEGRAFDPLPELAGGTGLDTAAGGERDVVVFPLLHGPMGEDGTVQGLLELAGVPYVGSGVLGSAVCMDKVAAKALTTAAGIPQARYLTARDVDVDAAFAQRVIDELGLPVFVKPANLGSSVGITKASTPDELDAALALATSFDEFVVVEEAVDAREIEVGVLGNGAPRASIPGEIVPTRDFYDYEDKYLEGAARMEIPADLPPDVAARARALALDAYRALRADGLARVDFFYEASGPSRGLLLNELNTMPGFTPFSMYPSLWAATGVSYGELIDELVRLAQERHAHRAPHRRPR